MSGPVAPRGANRAGQARQASDIAAGSRFILHRNNAVHAAVYIVAGRGKGADRAVRQAWFFNTGVARMLAGLARQSDRDRQQDGGPICVPETVIGMDLNPDRR